MSERVVAAAAESAPVGEVGSALVEEENGLVVAVEANVQAVEGNVLEEGAENVPEVVVNEQEEEEIEQAVVVLTLVEETSEKLAADAPCAWEGMVLKLEASDSMTAMALRIWICRNRQASSPPEHKPWQAFALAARASNCCCRPGKCLSWKAAHKLDPRH